MSVEESEICQDMKQYSQNNRAENIRISIEYLKDNHIKFVYATKKPSAILIIKHQFIDPIYFRADIGVWQIRGLNIRFGVRTLIKYITEKRNRHAKNIKHI